MDERREIFRVISSYINTALNQSALRNQKSCIISSYNIGKAWNSDDSTIIKTFPVYSLFDIWSMYSVCTTRFYWNIFMHAKGINTANDNVM